MPELGDIIFKCVEGIGGMIGVDEKLKEIMGLGGPKSLTKDDITSAVKDLLVETNLEDKVIQATTTLGDARAAFVDYDNQTDPVRLLNLMTEGEKIEDPLSLNSTGGNLNGWIGVATGAKQLTPAIKALTLLGTMACHVCLYWRTRANVEDNSKSDATGDDLKTMRQSARDAITQILDSLNAIWSARIGCLSYETENLGYQTDVNDPHKFGYVQTTIHDTLFDGGASTLICQIRTTDITAFSSLTIEQIWDAYRWALWGGNDFRAGSLRDNLGVLLTQEHDRWSGGPHYLGDRNSWNADFVDQSYQQVVEFGQHAVNVRQQLVELDLIASGVAACGQEGWSWCEFCGVLFYAGVKSLCPLNPLQPGAFNGLLLSHGQRTQQSADYVVRFRCDAVEAAPMPPSMQDGWCWCKNCGGLFHPGSNGAANVCATGLQGPFVGLPRPTQPHDGTGSGKYIMGYAATPDDDHRGFDVQADWHWCSKCGALHFVGANGPVVGANGPGACPAGGQHAIGDANYWLPHFCAPPRVTSAMPWYWSP